MGGSKSRFYTTFSFTSNIGQLYSEVYFLQNAPMTGNVIILCREPGLLALQGVAERPQLAFCHLSITEGMSHKP